MRTLLIDRGSLMIDEIRYRLGNYILTEYSNVLLMWAINSAFGGQRTGHCIIIDNILVLMPWERKEVGYLRFEFHSNKTKLPPWNKTNFYCCSSDIQQVGIPQILAKTALNHLSLNSSPQPTQFTRPCSFRLGRNKIITDGKGAMVWRAIGESGRSIGGKCTIESGILFLCPKEYEDDEEKSRLFYSELKTLPEWNTTCAWGHQESLLICKDIELKDSTFAVSNRDRMKSYFENHIGHYYKPKTQ